MEPEPERSAEFTCLPPERAACHKTRTGALQKTEQGRKRAGNLEAVDPGSYFLFIYLLSEIKIKIFLKWFDLISLILSFIIIHIYIYIYIELVNLSSTLTLTLHKYINPPPPNK